MIYASAIRLAVLKFLMSMSASAECARFASLEVDLSKIQPGASYGGQIGEGNRCLFEGERRMRSRRRMRWMLEN